MANPSAPTWASRRAGRVLPPWPLSLPKPRNSSSSQSEEKACQLRFMPVGELNQRGDVIGEIGGVAQPAAQDPDAGFPSRALRRVSRVQEAASLIPGVRRDPEAGGDLSGREVGLVIRIDPAVHFRSGGSGISVFVAGSGSGSGMFRRSQAGAWMTSGLFEPSHRRPRRLSSDPAAGSLRHEPTAMCCKSWMRKRNLWITARNQGDRRALPCSVRRTRRALRHPRRPDAPSHAVPCGLIQPDGDRGGDATSPETAH